MDVHMKIYNVHCTVYISSVQPPTKDAQDISRKHYVLLKMTSLTGLSKSDRHTDHTVLTCANQYYTWPKIVVHRQLGLHGLLDCSSKCPRVLLVLSVPIRPLIAKSSSQDTASNNCILSLWLPGKDSSILIMSFLSLFHSVMESCIEVQKKVCIESKSASPYPSSYSSAFLPASWTALEKKTPHPSPNQLNKLQEKNWRLPRAMHKLKQHAPGIRVWSGQLITSLPCSPFSAVPS